MRQDDMTVEGWDELVETLRELPARMLNRLPEKMRMDPQVRQEAARLALASLAGSALDTLSWGGDHPFFLPQLNILTFAGQPNPDTIYRYTRITPGGTYRMRGTRGSMRIATIGEMSPYLVVGDTLQPTPIKMYHDINTLTVDEDDRFDVVLSPERPKNSSRDWWPLQPDTNRLLLRFVSSDWASEREPTIAVERLDAPADRPRPAADATTAKLRELPREVAFLSTLFVDKVERLRSVGYLNRFKVFDVSGMGGLSGQSYFEGPYELNDDEALVIEAPAPEECLYRSIMVTNELYDTLDWYNNQTSLNGSQSHPDPDGVLRFVLSSRDPGVPNWLSVAGHRRGLVQGRWMNCSSSPIPTTRKVSFEHVRAHLHPDTPFVTHEQRAEIIRERRAALQQRSLW